MASHSHTSRSWSQCLNDLDLQPVRERVLNDIPTEPVSETPRVKFNFVDVSFPKPPKTQSKVCPVQTQPGASKSPRKRSNFVNIKEGSARGQERYDKENTFATGTCHPQRSMEGDRQEFLRQLLRRGVPVWEEVPEEERAAKIIGGPNLLRHHPYSSNSLASNITLRNSNKQKSGKITRAVWNEVKDSSRNVNNDYLIDCPKESARNTEETYMYEDRERKFSGYIDDETGQNLKSRSSSSSQSPHSTPCEAHSRQHSISLAPTEPVQREIQEPAACPSFRSSGAEVSQANSTSQELGSEFVQSKKGSSQSQGSQQGIAVSPTHHQGIAQTGRGDGDHHSMASDEDGGHERASRPGVKRIYGGRIDNDATASISWWPGDKLYKERGKKEEEEKHEKESTKEKRSKRDLSAPSHCSPEHSKRRHLVASQEEPEQMPSKTPPRVRHYEQAEVRKYMREKQTERMKTLKDQQLRQEQEKVQRSERLKELAIKTRQLSQVNKKEVSCTVTIGPKYRDQIQADQQPPVNWGCAEDLEYEPLPKSSPKHSRTQRTEQHIPLTLETDERSGKSPKSRAADKEASQVPAVPLSAAAIKEEMERENTSSKKRRKRDSRGKKKRQSLSDSEAITDIVSRTVEECERQVRSSSVSVESLSSLSSFSCTSSDGESKSSLYESLGSSLDLAPKERVMALGQLAQKLTSKITQETENLKPQKKDKQNVNDTPVPASSREEAARRPPLHTGNVGSEPRASLSYSQIEAMSVEELIAKMTAMLPNKSVSEGRSTGACASSQVDLQSRSRDSEKKQRARHGTHLKEGSERDKDIHTQGPSKEKSDAATNEQLPKLVLPDVPKLTLRSGGSIKIRPHQFEDPQVENLTSLPGHNVIHAVKGSLSQTDEEKQVFVRMTPTHKLQHVQSPGNTYYSRQTHDRRQLNNAAIIIQAAYRGYRVRKITSSLIHRRPLRHPKNSGSKFSTRVHHSANTNTGPKSSTFFKNSHNIREGSGNLLLQNVQPGEGVEQVDWRQIRANLENQTFMTREESYYVSQHSKLPEWIKPYFVLSETGDVKNFLETPVKEHEHPRPATAKEEGSASNEGPEAGDSVRASYSNANKALHDVTLTEGPLSDIERAEATYIEKGTQTNLNKSKNTMQEKVHVPLENKNSYDELQNFIDLKKFSGKKILALHDRNMIGNGPKTETSRASPSETQSRLQSSMSQTEPNDTLEEGLLEGASSCQISGNVTLDSGSSTTHSSTDEGLLAESSGVLESPNGSASVTIEEASAPHELLGHGVHFAPASLRLRLNAELMYQDTLGKALNQLHSVEQLNILTRSRQEASGLSQSLQRQKNELAAKWKQEDEVREREKETKRRAEYEKLMKEKLNQQEESLQNVEKIEKEARNRFAELEREVRARAEQVIAQAAERAQPSNTQSDVIAAAAVAAVGATISQWRQLRPVQGAREVPYSSVTLSEGQVSTPAPGSYQSNSSFSKPVSDRSHARVSCITKSSSSEGNLTSSKKPTYVSERLDDSVSNNSIIEELPLSSSTHTSPYQNQNTETATEYSCKTGDDSSQELRSKSVSEEIRSALTEERDSLRPVSKAFEPIKSITDTKIRSSKDASGSSSVPENIVESKSSGTVTEVIPENSLAHATSSEADMVSTMKTSQSHRSLSTRDLRRNQLKEPFTPKKFDASSLASMSSKSKENNRKKEERDTSDVYSESFEVESESDGSCTSSSSSSSSQLQGKGPGVYGGDLALVVSSGNILHDLSYRTSPHATGGGSESALGVTLNLVESLQKEEEVRHQHQKALLKLQEQSLVEETKWKLAALQSEGGPGMRRRQRAILLQLREQRTHLRRLIETQNIAAQQRRLMLLQHHHLLATTTNLSGLNTRGYISTLRGYSPSPGSPRLTPRLMEMGGSSSSDAQEDITVNLLMKGRDTGSSSPSDGGGGGGGGGGREKRRSHSEERLKMTSSRIHEKRRTADTEALQQQLLYEEKEFLRLKTKPFDIHEKDSMKPKRKGDFVTKRPREKRDKSPSAHSPLSVLVQSSRTSANSSVPEEVMDASNRDSQSSVPEEGGTETVSQSDVASSVSEQESIMSASDRMEHSRSLEVHGTNILSSYEGGISKREGNGSCVISPEILSINAMEFNLEAEKEMVSSTDSKITAKSYSIKTITTGEATASPEEKHYDDKSDKNSRGIEMSSSNKSEISENVPKSMDSSVVTRLNSAGSNKSVWSKSECTIPEDVAESSKVKTASSSSRCGSDTLNGTEVRSNSAKSVETRSSSQKLSSSKGIPLPLKVPLSPRSPHQQHRRYSSESDDSFTLSQTETASDVSDGEGKLLALKEQLAVRRAEAERLKKEKRRLRRERLASQERALRQQISTYDAYIQHARMELEKESKELQQASMVRPLIKKPQVAETKKSKLSESQVTSPEKSDISDLSLVSDGSKSDTSVASRSEVKSEESHHLASQQIKRLQEPDVGQLRRASLREHEVVASASSKEIETEENISSNRVAIPSDTTVSQRENESLKTSQTTSVSEEFAYEEEDFSEHTHEDSSKKSLSRESSVDTDHTQSQASSTETIVHSPKKLDSSWKNENVISVSEVNAALLEIIKDDEINKSTNTNEARVHGDPGSQVVGEKKLEIHIPTTNIESPEAEEQMEGNTDTSAEESICEEVIEHSFEESDNENDQELEMPKSLLCHLTEENRSAENNVTAPSSVLLLDQEISVRLGPASKADTPSEAPQTKETLPVESESRTKPPTLGRQRLADNISNILLASMMKDTSQLFVDILKEKVHISKVSVAGDEGSNISQATELSCDISEPSSSNGDVSLHSQTASLTLEEDTSVSKSSHSSKSQILQRVNKLIGEGSPGSPSHSPSHTSPRPADLQVTSQLTFDLSPDSSPPVSLTSALPCTVDKDAEVQPSGGVSPPISGGEAIIPNLSATVTQSNQEDSDSLSPSHDVVKAEEYQLDTGALTSRLLNLAATPELDLEAKLSHLGGEDTEFSVEGIEGDWFDDDFWTSSDTKRKQQQLKAEEERIVAEIARLEELQHLQQQYPGLVIREVPNKPPPPYTPPLALSPPSPGSCPTPANPPAYTSPSTSPAPPEAQPQGATHSSSSIPHRLSKADQRKLAAHITQVVPVSQEEVLPIIDSSLTMLYEAWQDGHDPGDVPLPPHITPPVDSSSSHNEGDDLQEDEETSSRAFRHLLFNLARELVSVPYRLQHTPQPPPWVRQVRPHTRILGTVHKKSRADLFSRIQEQVKVVFGWKPSLEKESLMVRWAQKHRDLVDQVLVKELQAEEASWTNYDEDEAAVKTKVATEIFDALLSETVRLVSSIIARKLAYNVH